MSATPAPSVEPPGRALRVAVGVLIAIGVAAVVRRAILVVPALFAADSSVEPRAGSPAAWPPAGVCPR